MSKLTPLLSILSGFASNSKLNTNFSRITSAFDNTLSRDGSSPNAMEADLDMNSNRILNLPNPTDPSDPVTLGYLEAQAYQGTGGATPTITVGTVTTGAAGSSAQVTTTGSTPPDYVFNFTIPRGDAGTSGSGSGDVVGPASATDNAIARFDTTTGKLLQNSGATVSDAGAITAASVLLTGDLTADTLSLTTTGRLGWSGGSRIFANGDGGAALKTNAGVTTFSVDASGNGVFAGTSVTVGGTAVSLAGHTHAYSSLTSIPAAIDAIGGLTPAADQIAYYTSASAAALTSLTSFGRSLVDDADASAARTTLGLGSLATASTITASQISDPTNVKSTESLIVACSDETTALTVGAGKVTFRMPYAFTVTAVRASLTTAQTSGSILTVDINEAGTSILSTKLTIDNAEKTSTTAATIPVISDSSLADDAEITVDIDQVGDGTAKGLKIYLIGRRT